MSLALSETPKTDSITSRPNYDMIYNVNKCKNITVYFYVSHLSQSQPAGHARAFIAIIHALDSKKKKVPAVLFR